MSYDYSDPAVVQVALISESPWPDLPAVCDGSEDKHPAKWVVWTTTDTGDGMRTACDYDLGDWVQAVAGRLW